MRRLAVFLVLAVTAVLVPAAPAAAALPDELAHVGNARQVIVVAGRSWASTHATVRAFQRGSDGKWRQKFGTMNARTGYGGWKWASSRRQDTGQTPAGTFTLTQAFGVRADPGTRLPYRKVDADDYWAGDNRDPETYNLLQPSASPKRTWRKSRAERLAAYPRQYAHAIVINFNTPSGVRWDAAHRQYTATTRADTRRGSAIFLHAGGSGPTAGCVSVKRADLVRLLRWLDPAAKPRIVMAPATAITRA
ncbi:hypothetical protein Aph02nite_92840 [Actinoplanes philippinensis]|uniref:L,D-peptidoglycan transpeptidase YkuD, ErfK/YbiS/YcfS/YnhG family n=1 Tax=Actinoplanes philippinensis TaxID=35752 RepID=A0A1I2N1S0_9ACTN|nr:L,D-transpeptidase family protein [Actinoplanes philippinensis]GIE83334.1 hypothetical protein Aph02nite_92840 [Actinoplanes philippinensis]SFF97593.1 L,D-peptidoglycan transpeptidase YkuD, ErfK/YbiS/YcfS/YnhG family [Actinoplanes philippinensis]